ncbi:MAG TPA: hypothetical protein VGG33_04760 [Polyangia bacterium]
MKAFRERGVLPIGLLLLFAACGDETKTSEGCMLRRCYFNPATQTYDRDCMFVQVDAACPQDAGVHRPLSTD